MEKHTTPITKVDWQSLKVGDGIKDEYGRVWEVTKRIPEKPDELFACCPEYSPELLIWFDGQILEFDEVAYIVELNHPNVSIVRK